MDSFIADQICVPQATPIATAIGIPDTHLVRLAERKIEVSRELASRQEPDLKGPLAREDGQLLDQIRDTPAQSLLDVVMKLRVLDAVENFSADLGSKHAEGDYFRHWKGELLRDAERLCRLQQSGDASCGQHRAVESAQGPIANNVTQPHHVASTESPRKTNADELSALQWFWANSVVIGQADGFTTTVVTMPTEQAATLYKLIGDPPDNPPFPDFSDDAADPARWKTLANWVCHQITLHIQEEGRS